MNPAYFSDNSRPSRGGPALLLAGLLLSVIQVSGSGKQTGLDSLFCAKKTIEAVRIQTPPKIDGRLNEPFWKELPVAGDFVQYAPWNGKKPAFPTEIRFAYDDEALYVGAIMFDPHPDSIFKELGRRDKIESLNTDYISFDILPYNDELNMYEFKVSPSNLQNDCKYSAIGVDITWDAVWQSATSTNDSSWIVEVRIPYSALRLPRFENQVWGINMWRNLQRRHEYSTWTFVDITDNNIFTYYGKLTGIYSIKPPVRLSFTPYLSAYVEKIPEIRNWSYFIRGGMDLRYGINESYTLDMMLIPDFGQVQSDDLILNLTPFEVRYNEKRQFFTEATELFDKCGIFYSRRVGSIPKNYFAPYDSMTSRETVIKNPDLTRIINATKISGRNTKGLGIGFFNAMTTNTWSVLEDTVSGDTRRIMTQGFTNYNVLVVDQNLKNNSYATFINTNYWTPDSRYVANVTGAEARICNKKNTLSVLGRLNVSQIYQEGSAPVIGHNYVVSVSKPSGKFQYEITREEIGDKYDPNDMGFLTNNNQADNTLRMSYNLFTPFWKILSTQTEFLVNYSTLYKPYDFSSLRFQVYNLTGFTNFWQNYLEAGVNPLGYKDHYEPRVWGWTYRKPYAYDVTWKIATDTRKMFRIHNTVGIMNSPSNKNFEYWIEAIPRFRFSDKLTLSFDILYDNNKNDNGWVETLYDSLNNPVIFFGRRDVITLSNIINISYIFNTKASISLRARHYWSRARYYEFFTLDPDGNLEKSDYQGDHNINFNAITVDLQFVWYFAPGSELSVVWKNVINTMDNMVDIDYMTDFKNTINSPQSNSFSVRVLYYLDYLNIKKLFSRKKA